MLEELSMLKYILKEMRLFRAPLNINQKLISSQLDLSSVENICTHSNPPRFEGAQIVNKQICLLPAELNSPNLESLPNLHQPNKVSISV
jgi:hypothetical protein